MYASTNYHIVLSIQLGQSLSHLLFVSLFVKVRAIKHHHIHVLIINVTSFSSISYYSNLRLISNMLYEQRHLLYTFRHPCFRTQVSSHSFLCQATWHKWILHKFNHRNKITLTLASLFIISSGNKHGWDSILDAI